MLPMVNDSFLIVDKESSVVKHQKVEKIDGKIRKGEQKLISKTALDLNSQ
jgi:hypothetical protein